MDVLVYLLERPGEVVTVGELLDQVWAGRVVEETTVYKRISNLRQTFGDDAQNPDYIENIPRRGYRTKAPVALVGTPRVPARPRTSIVVLAVVLIAVLGLGLSFSLDQPPAPLVEGITVLPLENLGDESTEVLTRGIGEDILNGLARATTAKVIGGGSSAQLTGDRRHPAYIHEALGVSHAVTGSVRRLGDNVRVTAQLIAVPSGEQLWAHRFDSEVSAIYALKDQVVGEVLRALHFQFVPHRAPKTVVPAAYAAYVEGRWHFGEFRFDEAIHHWQRATVLDPDFGEAYAALANIEVVKVWTGRTSVAEALKAIETEGHLERALALDPDNPAARGARATLQFFVERDLQGGIDAYHEILREHPNDVPTLANYSILLRSVDRIDLMLRVMRRAISLDPIGPVLKGQFIDNLVYAGRYDEARGMIEKARNEGNPEVLGRLTWTADLYAQMAWDEGNVDEVRAQLEHVDPTMRNVWVARLAHDADDQATLDATLAQLAPQAEEYFVRLQMGLLTGDYDAVIDNLESAIVDRWWLMSWAEGCPCRADQPRGGFSWLARTKYPGFYADPRRQTILEAYGIDRDSIAAVVVPDLPF